MERLEMTSSKVNDYYKRISLVTLTLSLIAPIIHSSGSFTERIWLILGINIQFHLAYQFLSRVLIGIYNQTEKDSPNTKPLIKKGLIVFAILTMILSVIGLLGFIVSVISQQTYDQLFLIMVFVGVFLGGFSSKLKLVGN